MQIDPPVVNDFENPHEGNPELAEAYAAGYMDAAFGDHIADDPLPVPPGPRAEAWLGGFSEGEKRFEAYKKGFSRGINRGLEGLASDTTPAPFEPGDRFNAWTEGREDGLRVGRIVRDEIAEKAQTSDHFDEPTGKIHSAPVGENIRLWWQEWNNGGGIYVERSMDTSLPVATAFAVDAPIHAEYKKVSGVHGFLGRPIGDTQRVPDGRGKVSQFQHGSMYSTDTTGAHEVHGEIRERWLQRGGPSSDLGYPTSNELAERADGGRVNTFENGDVYFWSDIGVVDLLGVQIRYTGLRCFGTTSGPGEDEIYVIGTPIGPTPDKIVSARTPIIDVAGPGTFPAEQVLYTGPPAGVGGLTASIAEHDLGDANKFREQIQAGVRTGLNALAAAIAATGVGLIVSGIAVALANAAAGPIGDAINDVLDTDDDHLGTAVFPLAPRALIELAEADHQEDGDLRFNLTTGQINSDEGSYQAYFDVVFV